jgi:hypothetical protein
VKISLRPIRYAARVGPDEQVEHFTRLVRLVLGPEKGRPLEHRGRGLLAAREARVDAEVRRLGIDRLVVALERLGHVVLRVAGALVLWILCEEVREAGPCG